MTEALPHGARDSRQGFLVAAIVEEGAERFVHASDVQLFDRPTVESLASLEPTTLLASGPPTYHPEVSADLKTEGLRNLSFLAARVPILIVDHHLLRDAEYSSKIEDALDVAARAGHRLVTAAEHPGATPALLEASRRDLYRRHPAPSDWPESFLSGVG